MALLEVSNLGIAVRRPAGCVPVGSLHRKRASLWSDRSQRRRQNHGVQHAHRRVPPPRKAISYWTAKTSPGRILNFISRAGVARTFQNIRLFNDMTVLDNVKVGLHNQIKYSMWTGIFRLPAYKEKEHEMNRAAHKLLKIFDLDKESGYKASPAAVRQTAQAGDCPRAGHQPETVAAGTNPRQA